MSKQKQAVEAGSMTAVHCKGSWILFRGKNQVVAVVADCSCHAIVKIIRAMMGSRFGDGGAALADAKREILR